MFYCFASNTFSFLLGLRAAWWCDKLSILSIFKCLGPFPQVFGQIKDWFILDLQEMIRVPIVALRPDLGWQTGVIRFMKNVQF